MEWMQLLGLILAGGLSSEALRQLGGGLRQLRRARGSTRKQTDALRWSRLWWMERAHTARRQLIEAGCDPKPLQEENDPYLKWETRDTREKWE